MPMIEKMQWALLTTNQPPLEKEKDPSTGDGTSKEDLEALFSHRAIQDLMQKHAEEKSTSYELGKKEGYKQGHEKGHGEGLESALKKHETSLQHQEHNLKNHIDTQLQEILSKIHANQHHLIQGVIQGTVESLHRVFPLMRKKFFLQQIKNLVEEALLLSASPAPLTIKAEKKTLENIKSFVDPAKLSLLSFEESPEKTPFEAHIQWAEGGVEYSPQKIVWEIERLFKDFENIFKESKEDNQKTSKDSTTSNAYALDASKSTNNMHDNGDTK